MNVIKGKDSYYGDMDCFLFGGMKEDVYVRMLRIQVILEYRIIFEAFNLQQENLAVRFNALLSAIFNRSYLIIIRNHVALR